MNLLQTLGDALVKFIGRMNWTLKNGITPEEELKIKSLLAKDYYVVLTRNKAHLAAYAISFGDFLTTGKFGYWAHGLMNFEDTVKTCDDFRLVDATQDGDDDDFTLIQSTGPGVAYATFPEVFTCSSAVLLKPKNMPIEDWTLILDKAKTEIGKPYDTLYDMSQDLKLSCVELVRQALMADPTYYTNFAKFEAMVQKYKRITPQMLYDCGDFEVAYEVKH